MQKVFEYFTLLFIKEAEFLGTPELMWNHVNLVFRGLQLRKYLWWAISSPKRKCWCANLQCPENYGFCGEWDLFITVGSNPAQPCLYIKRKPDHGEPKMGRKSIRTRLPQARECQETGKKVQQALSIRATDLSLQTVRCHISDSDICYLTPVN